MTKLKKFTITCGAIFLVCALTVLVMLPFCVNDLVDSYNEIISDNMEFTYQETTLDENVKNLNIYNSCYVEIRKSKDNLIHVKTLNAGITNFSANVYYYDSDDKAELSFSQKGNGTITKDNIIKTINWYINHIPEAIVYVPQNVNITTEWERLRNPYTGKFYPPKSTDNYNPSSNEKSATVVTDKASLILEINECKNTLQQLYYELDEKRAEYTEQIQSNVIIGIDSFDYLYENILTERLHMVDLIYSFNQNEEMRIEYEKIAYTLTANEQALDISKLKIEIAKQDQDYDREPFIKIRNEENAKIEVSQKIVSDLSLKFENYIKLSLNEPYEETNMSSADEHSMPSDEENTSSQSSKPPYESESSKTEDNSSSEN